MLSLPQIDLNMPREETLLQAGCSSTLLCVTNTLLNKISLHVQNELCAPPVDEGG